MWAIKDSSITRTFFDEGAATFFLPHLASQPTGRQTASNSEEIVEISPLKRTKYTVESHSRPESENGKGTRARMGMEAGGALGPDWHSELKMTGKAFKEVGTFATAVV